MAKVAVCLELATKRVFASALEWPGWCRAGRDEAQAIEALVAYASRYTKVASEAGLKLPAKPEVDVVERLAGSAGTDFGVPGAIAKHEQRALSKNEADRRIALVEAGWRVFDGVAKRAPAALSKGPRGGGRDRDKIVEHVLGAEVAYAQKLGARLKQPNLGDANAIAEHRSAIVAALRDPQSPPKSKPWPAAYAARRIALLPPKRIGTEVWRFCTRSNRIGIRIALNRLL